LRRVQLTLHEVRNHADSLENIVQVYFEESRESKIELNAKNKIIQAKSREVLACEELLRMEQFRYDSVVRVLDSYHRVRPNN